MPDLHDFTASGALNDNRTRYTQDVEGLFAPQILSIRTARHGKCLLLAAWKRVLGSRILLHEGLGLGNLGRGLGREHHIQRQFERVVEHPRNQMA